jgi:hypothetical protein
MKPSARVRFAIALGAALFARDAWAQGAPSPRFGLLAREREAALDAPAPPTLPELAHKHLDYSFELTGARLEPNREGSASEAPEAGAYAWFAHGALELPLVPRTWYVGVANDVVSAALPGVGSATLLGNPELWGRGVWSSVRGLSAGAGLGVVLPVPREADAREREVLRTVRTVRPWDAAYFDDLTLTFRPWFDVRHVVDRLMFQLRQGVDWSIDEGGLDLTARVTFYAGYRAGETLGVGLEIWEVYELTAEPLDDERRAAVAISPSVRLLWPNVKPSLSVLLPIATPLRGDVDSYYALRLGVAFSFDYPPATEDGAAGSARLR